MYIGNNIIVPSGEPALILDYNAAEGVTLAAGRASQWDDTSGFSSDINRNAIQGVAGNQPLFTAVDADFNGQPSLTFDGAARDDRMVTGVFATPIPAGTTWLVVGRHTGVDTGAISFYLDGLNGVNRQPLFFQAPAALNFTAGVATLTALGMSAPRSIIAVARAGANGRLYVNDVSALATGNAGVNTQTGVTIGAGNGAPAGFFLIGKIARILAWGGNLSQTYIETVLLPWASAKYGIPVNTLTTVLPLGDSITVGFNGNPGGWRKVLFDMRPSWVGRGSFQDPAGYFHNGVAGWTLADMNANWGGVWGANRANEVWVSGGTNDIFTGLTGAAALVRMNTLLTTIEGLAPAPTIIRVATIPPLPAFLAETNAFNAGLPAVIAGHPTAVIAHVGDLLALSDISGDNVHPTVLGHEKMAGGWSLSIP